MKKSNQKFPKLIRKILLRKREVFKMKQETYVKISKFVRSRRYGEDIVKYGNILVTRIIYVAFLVMLITLLLQKDERIVRVVLVTGISFALVSVFRHFYNEDRPYTIYDFDPVVKKNKTGESMPSRHVFSGFVIGMAFLYVQPCLSIPMFICSVLMCFGRVIAGVHFPKDVIAGAVIGIISGIVGFYLI
jgi:membrane-associated phospholipid phosphatase